MRIVVTGGAGFIGSHVVDGALEAGNQVCVLDDLSTGNRANVSSKAELIVGDVRDAALVEKLFADFKPDIVCHHAAQVSVPASFTDPDHDLSVNALGTLCILEAARHQKSHVVYASSGGAIYGEVSPPEIATIQTKANPSTPYGCSKLAGELYVQAYAAHYGMRASILRYSNVYGPRQNSEGEGGVVAIFVKNLLQNQSISVYARDKVGDAGCIRDYVYVGDVVKANLSAFAGKLDGATLNVSTGTETTTEALAKLSLELSGSKATLDYRSPREGDVKRSVLEPSALPYPLTLLRRGLELTIEWARSSDHL